MKRIYDLTYDALKQEIISLELPKFTVDQVFQWLYWKITPDISQWTNISKNNREKLSKHFDTALDEMSTAEKDGEGTRKFLFRLKDGYFVESVLIKEKHHYTFCISSQVGCALKCGFCATGQLGFKRNLTPGEILSQVLQLKKELGGPDPTGQYKGKLNLVFMGMGEPLLNYENLKQALDILTDDKGVSISSRNITVSTAGILANIQRLEQDFPKLKISFSLNAPDSNLREQIMPISRKEKLTDILEYFRRTSRERRHRITFEYVMLKDVNDSPQHAAQTARLLRGISCKINLIPYNPNESLPFKTPAQEAVDNFSDYLHSLGYTVIVRWSKGRGIKSACGQLAGAQPAGPWKDIDDAVKK